ncbi:MAG: methyltransferase domain-containing protein [Gammaproteobacteria bacterium]|nr:methyltransferase domain-containing protein [Gammaproteobacteria bacterium]
MVDLLGLDPARIARLRDPARYDLVDPSQLWTVVQKPDGGTVLDVGAGVGFVTFAFASELPSAHIVACDILPGMLDLLTEDAGQRDARNIECRVMPGPVDLPLADGEVAMVVMLQVHHELDEPEALLRECHRVLSPEGCLAIVDWKDEDIDGVPPAGRRVPLPVIREQLSRAGFTQIASHPLYTAHNCVTARP